MTATDWDDRGACKQVSDPEIFFPVRPNTIDAAKAAAYCRTCPVAEPCYTRAKNGTRTSGIFGGYFWTEGHPQPIPDPQALAAQPSRSEIATRRRREGINRYYLIRHQHENDTKAYCQVADEYGVTVSTVREWHRQTRAEHNRAVAAIDQNVRESA